MAAVLCAVLLGMAAAGLSGGDSYVGGLLSVVLSPFEKGAAYIAEFADDLSLNFRSASYYREQNEELESQLDELLRKTADYDDIKNRLEAYEIYTESGNDEFTKVYAQVTGRDSADVCSSMTLGVGTANGVSADGLTIWTARRNVSPGFSSGVLSFGAAKRLTFANDVPSRGAWSCSR